MIAGSVSVCMASYNGERYIRKQIDSILLQLTYKDELIISDDNSTDSTMKIINSYKDDRIKVYHHEQREYERKNKSLQFKRVTKNFENALCHANGDYVFLSDQDDLWLENRVKTVINYLKSYDLVICNFSIINQYDDIVKKRYYLKDPISGNILLNIIRSRFLGCCMAFRRRLLQYVLPFPEKIIAHDFWIGTVGSVFGKHYFINIPLHAYRRHCETVSTSTDKSNNSLFYKIYYRFEILISLIVRLISLIRKNTYANIANR